MGSYLRDNSPAISLLFCSVLEPLWRPPCCRLRPSRHASSSRPGTQGRRWPSDHRLLQPQWVVTGAHPGLSILIYIWHILWNRTRLMRHRDRSTLYSPLPTESSAIQFSFRTITQISSSSFCPCPLFPSALAGNKSICPQYRTGLICPWPHPR